MNKKMKNEDPYKVFGLGGYQMIRDFTDSEEYNLQIREKYRKLVELTTTSFPRDVDKMEEELRWLDELYQKISTRERRVKLYKEKGLNADVTNVRYVKETQPLMDTPSFLLDGKQFFIRKIGTLHFMHKINRVEDYINKYAITLPDGRGTEIVYTTLDVSKIKDDSEYARFVLEELFSDNSFKVAKKINSGYLGDVRKDGRGRYSITYDLPMLGAVVQYNARQEEILQEDEEER